MPGVDASASSDHVPRWLWRALGVTLGLVMLGSGLLFGLLALGAADPPFAGPLAWEQVAPAGECLSTTALVLPDLYVPVTVVLRARVETPPAALTTWGLWLDTPESPLRWEVLPPGYFRYAGQTHPFFHVHDGMNDLRLDLAEDSAQLRLNQELALDMPPASLATANWGLVDRPGVCWQGIAVYSGD